MFVAVVCLANPSRAVEEEGEPADPAPELNPANCLDSRWEVDCSVPECLQYTESRLRCPFS